MRILQVSTFDGKFGASIAARRLHQALLSGGHDSNFFVREIIFDGARTSKPKGKLRQWGFHLASQLDRVPLLLYPNREPVDFSPNWVPSEIVGEVKTFAPDVVHLHWVQSCFVPTHDFRNLKPLVWTPHDMWAFTGGCHYTSGCDRYMTGCGRCPILKSSLDLDITSVAWKQKRRVFDKIRSSLQIICGSNWLAGLVRQSPLLEGVSVHVLPNPINTNIFKPMDKGFARRLLNLPEGIPLLAFGKTQKSDYRKGFDLLNQALIRFGTQSANTELGLVTFGKIVGGGEKPKNMRIWELGILQDELSLCALYNAVDVLAVPSREENLANTIAESLCCGTPCLAFDIGGNSDLVQHKVNGYLAKPESTEDLAEGLEWILQNLGVKQSPSISASSGEKVGFDQLAPRFVEVYRQAIAARG
jgi:glycosyltransferase involved in cell wall biosynthesis